VVAAVVREKKEAAARAALQQVLAASNTAAELEANAKKAGLSASLTGWFAPLEEAPPGALAAAGDLRKELSSLSEKSPVSRKIHPGRGGSFLAVAFSSEQFPDDTEWARRKDALLRGLAEQKKNAMVEAFLSDRRKSAKVEIHPDALK